jgi:pimeloyl-ACP methyl ester carboxylesterase
VSRLVACPGFGDTPRYWADLFDPAGAVTGVSWPGLWDTPSCDHPYQHTVAAGRDLVGPDGVVVGHSLGTRVALDVSPSARAAVLLAPALSDWSFVSPDACAVWRQRSHRPTHRPDPVSGVNVVVDIPFTFAQDLLDLPPPLPPPASPTLVITVSQDDDRLAQLTRQWAETASPSSPLTVETVDGPHRWWESPACASKIVSLVTRWLACVDIPS